MDSNDEDYGVDAGSLLVAVMRLQWQQKQQSTKSGNGDGGDGNGNSNIGWQQQRRQQHQVCGTDARSLLVAVVVNGGGIGMKLMEPIGIDEGCGKGAIAAAAINRQCSRGWLSSPSIDDK